VGGNEADKTAGGNRHSDNAQNAPKGGAEPSRSKSHVSSFAESGATLAMEGTK
jgi:hypothetical protein